MNSINPYVCFHGKCREAMAFYQQCFGGELVLQEVAGSPMEEFWQGPKDQILHAALSLNGLPLLMGSDMTDRLGYVKGTNIALALGFTSPEETHSVFEKLEQGGEVLEPLKQQFWGAIYGSLQDQFGIKWMLNCNQ
jgi:PhnB protein